MNDSPVTQGFFRWIRELNVRRGTDAWIGGVASGLAERFGLAPILVRGIFVALSCVAGLGLLFYGIAWAFLPGPDGSIHAQDAAAGRWRSGMTGALVFFVVGALGLPAVFGSWDGGFWTLAVIGLVLFLVFSRRGRFAERAAEQRADQHRAATGASGTPGASTAGLGNPFGPANAPQNPSGTAPGGSASAINTGKEPDGPAETPETPTARFQPLSQERTMPFPSSTPPDRPEIESSLPPFKPTPQDGTGHPGTGHPETGHAGGGGSTPPPYAGPAMAPAPRNPRHSSIPGYAATIVLGLAVLVFASIVGLHQLGMLGLPASSVAVGFAAALVVIALGLIGAALSRRTGGALVGFGIVALVLSLIWGGGAFRGAEHHQFNNGISTTEGNELTNVFHSGVVDLRYLSTITEDTSVSLDNLFSSVTVIVPDNIPVVLDSSGAFSSLQVGEQTSTTSGGSMQLNPGATGPTLRIDLDGAFNSVEVSVQKAEVAP